jgi:hypothetical protein
MMPGADGGAMARPMERPDYVTDEMLEFLDNLMDATPQVAKVAVMTQFHLDRIRAKYVVNYWIETWGSRHFQEGSGE